jgi:hypothetical protein
MKPQIKKKIGDISIMKLVAVDSPLQSESCHCKQPSLQQSCSLFRQCGTL